jgi:hypothetical protein
MLPVTRVLAPLITSRMPLPPCSYTCIAIERHRATGTGTHRHRDHHCLTPCRKTLSMMDIAPAPSLLSTEIPQLPYSTTACDSATVPRPVTRIPPQSPADGAALLEVKVISEPTLPATTRSPATTSSVRDMSVPPPVSSDNAWNRTVVPAARLSVIPSVPSRHRSAPPRRPTSHLPSNSRSWSAGSNLTVNRWAGAGASI